MAFNRDEVPLDDYDEQRPALDEEPEVREGEELPDREPDLTDNGSEADVLEQYQTVPEREDYEPGPATE